MPDLLPIFVPRDQQLENNYIGSKISMSASLTPEINTRLNLMAAAKAKNRINPLENSKFLVKLSLRGFIGAFVLSSALYGSKAWNVSLKAEIARFDSFQHHYYVAYFGFVLLSIYPTLASFIYIVVLV